MVSPLRTAPARPIARRARSLLPCAVALLLACGGEAPADKATPGAMTEADIPALAPAALLSRISLDLRGTRPTLEELAAVQADPAALDGLVAAMVDDPRFGVRVRQIYAEIYLTKADYYYISAAQFGLEDDIGFARAVGEEPLRVVERIATEDLPYTEVVTGDWTVANELLASIAPLDYPAGGEGWQVAHYTDGRPAAGVLATNGLWWRYTSTDSNANRKRANQVSRILLCNDYLSRPITFDRNIDLLDEQAVADAIHENPACVNCHTSLDPIAAYFFGFWAYDYTSALEVRAYHPDREHLYASYLDTSPAWYGAPGASLADLGQQIAGDPRFPECAVEQVYRALLRRDPTLDDTNPLVAHREAFLAGELRLKPLFLSVVADARYRAAPVDDPATEALGAVPMKLLTVDQLASSVEDITGFRWDYAGYDMLDNDTVGLRTLAGGVDGQTVTESATSPSATLLLVQERLAEAAASHVVTTESALPQADRALFTEIDGTETPESGRDAMVAQIQRLHLRLFGHTIAADGPEVEGNLGLWSELYAADGDAGAAWRGLLSALLRDPDFVLY